MIRVNGLDFIEIVKMFILKFWNMNLNMKFWWGSSNAGLLNLNRNIYVYI